MPPRGNESLDFAPILTHYLFLFTSILAVLAWFLAFIGQIISTAQFGNVGVLWFAIFLQLFLILGVLYTLASNSMAMHRLQITTFGAIAVVYAVQGTNAGIYSNAGPLNAMSAGWLILSIVDIIWLLYFTSDEDSLTFHIFNSMGTGGLTPPSRRRRRGTQNSIRNMSSGNAYSNNYASGGIGSTDGVGYDMKPASVGPGGGAGSVAAVGIRSQNSFNSPSVDNRSIGAAGSIQNAPSNAGSIGPGSTKGDDTGPTSPLMAGVGAGGSSSPPEPSAPAPQVEYQYKAKALYPYSANPADPSEISFSKGEVLDILDKAGKWWHARKADGTTGIAPSNYLQLI
ncbi:hypothetical protein AX16_000403 [Volvariella volvacea WC 439]|nr:hypothetical protein AX16_000403 [Volvariella volvacea WC 439]